MSILEGKYGHFSYNMSILEGKYGHFSSNMSPAWFVGKYRLMTAFNLLLWIRAKNLDGGCHHMSVRTGTCIGVREWITAFFVIYGKKVEMKQSTSSVKL